MLKDLKTTENTLIARTLIIKREKSCLETKLKFENKQLDNHKQMRNSRQNDKLEQWVMHAYGSQRCRPGIDPRL